MFGSFTTYNSQYALEFLGYHFYIVVVWVGFSHTDSTLLKG